MTYDEATLLGLLPALYRLRDTELASRLPSQLTAAEQAELAALEATGYAALDAIDRQRLTELRDQQTRGPLAAFLRLIARELGVLEDNLDQLYDDLFVETASDWALPYLGDLIGYRTLHPTTARWDRRAEIGHTIAFRRRKGTASMLEQLARDVTGFPGTAVVEFFSRLATTQSMIHVRPGHRVAPSLRDGRALEHLGGAFDAIPHTLDVRRIESGAGRYNVGNIGCFLWRLDALRHDGSPAVPHDASGRRFRFSPLGHDLALVNRPDREDDIAHLAEPAHVPGPITRRRLLHETAGLYGPERSLAVWLDGVLVPAASVVAANLADRGAGWMHEAPAGTVALDPELGRLALASDLPVPASVSVLFHVAGVSGTFGGSYPRRDSFALPEASVLRVPQDHADLQDALDALGGAGVVEITDSGRYAETLTITVAAGAAVEVRAADGQRPHLALTGPLQVTGGAGGQVHLNGLLVSGHPVTVSAGASLDLLRIAHCTLVPGRTLTAAGDATQPGAPSVTVASTATSLTVERTITGPVRLAERTAAVIVDTVVDAGTRTAEAIGGGGPAGHLELDGATVIGTVGAVTLAASNSLLLGLVQVLRRQEGCVRFSFLPPGSQVPRRHRCQPDPDATTVDVPHLRSLRFGTPAYARLAARTPATIGRGADDDSEMGAFGWLHEPQRLADLFLRFDEYLRVGLSAGAFDES